MKIAFWHFHTFRMLRGIETLVLSLANTLVQQGVEVSIVTAKPTVQPLVSPDERVKIYTYPTFQYYSHLAIVPFYFNHFLRYQYDQVVVFFADFGEGLTWRILQQFKRKMPLVLYLCYPYSAVPHRYRAFLQLGWEREARHILADGHWFAEEAEHLFQRPVPVVPVGTDPNRFRPDPALREQMRQEWGFTNSEVVLLNVSALERRKGIWRVIQAMARLRDQFPQLRYVILGQGDDESSLRDLVTELKLNRQVTFAGTTSHLEAYYNLADIFVMLPEAEANSIAGHEAMSCALPLIVSNTGGFAESVPQEAGLFVNPGSPAEIDTSLAQLITNAPLRHQMGQAGRHHILTHLSWQQVAERYLELAK